MSSLHDQPGIQELTSNCKRKPGVFDTEVIEEQRNLKQRLWLAEWETRTIVKRMMITSIFSGIISVTETVLLFLLLKPIMGARFLLIGVMIAAAVLINAMKQSGRIAAGIAGMTLNEISVAMGIAAQCLLHHRQLGTENGVLCAASGPCRTKQRMLRAAIAVLVVYMIVLGLTVILCWKFIRSRKERREAQHAYEVYDVDETSPEGSSKYSTTNNF